MKHPSFYRTRTASGLIQRYMIIAGFAGLATPWKTIYILPGQHSAQLLAHERCHIAQMERDGTCWFCLKYVAQLIRYGYTGAPYEIEARLAELDA